VPETVAAGNGPVAACTATGPARPAWSGTTILSGVGGVAAEPFEDTTMRLLPADGGPSRDETPNLAREPRTRPPPGGFRGRPKADGVDALVAAIAAAPQTAARPGERLVEAGTDAVFMQPQGRGARAADGVVGDVLAGRGAT
jgi:hypothetical protein